MLAALMIVAALPDLVPARWPYADPATLDLLSGTPENCLLLEQRHWSRAFSTEASRRSVVVLGVIRPGGDVS
jgi:hypothetical protein